MLIFPAIDLFEGKAVRLLKGNYARMTVYNEDPLSVARDFAAQGATCLHLVDLEGAKSGTTPNIDTIRRLAAESNLFTEVGGGIRTMNTVRAYLDAGVDRVILGTAAVKDEAFLREAVSAYGEKIAVGVDIRDGKVAIHGWTETSEIDAMDFMAKLEQIVPAVVRKVRLADHRLRRCIVPRGRAPSGKAESVRCHHWQSLLHRRHIPEGSN